MVTMPDKHQADLGDIQETLFIPLLARARETRKARPILRDPKAAEMIESIDFDEGKYGRAGAVGVVVLRTAIFDSWVRAFLEQHPAGTVVEMGTGLNTRFERVDNGRVHWIDLDLPDTIELRRKFFTDSSRRRMVAGSVLDDGWLQAAQDFPGPYFFIADGVLVYLREADVSRVLARIAERFPGALVAFDTYPRRTFQAQHRMAAKRGIRARWEWACDDPRSLERLGLRMVESTGITRPPQRVRAHLPPRYRYLLPLADPLFGKTLSLNLFEATTGRAAEGA